MKRVVFFLALAGAFLCQNVFSQNTFYDLTSWGIGYAAKISPNGKYIIGMSSKGRYLWNFSTGDIVYIGNANNYSNNGVNDNGDVAGRFPDSTYMVSTSSGVVAIQSAGIFKNNKWNRLNAGQVSLLSMGSSTTWGSTASAISNDGKRVFGMSYNRATFANVVPFEWKIDSNAVITDTVSFSYPAGDQGSRFWDVSSDGNVGCGFAVYTATNGARRPIVFKSPSEYKIINPTRQGDANDVSPNGKYVALTTGSLAAYYDVEKDKLVYCGNISGTSSAAVSDNGVVVGFREVTNPDGALGRKPFIWTDKLGYIEFADFIKTYTPDIKLPSTMNFTDPYAYDVPMGISADGKIITGWSGYNTVSRYGWVLKLENIIDVPERPRNVVATTDIEKRNMVTLKWEINKDTLNTLSGFKIYRDSVLIKEIHDLTALSYTDSIVPAGFPKYNIKAVYGNIESPYSDYTSTTVVNSYDLPLSENFESATLNTNYWTVKNANTNYWTILSSYGINRSNCLYFSTNASATQYQSTLQTRPIDATAYSKVYLSFIHKVAATVVAGLTDTLYVEVSSDIKGTSWTVAKRYLAIQQSQVYVPEIIDLTNLVAGKRVLIRFRMSGKDRKVFTYFIDNIAFTTAIPEAPKNILVTKSNAYQKITWQEPTGSYALTYGMTDKYQTIGNEGMPFIAANKFDSIDLKKYKGKYLTSISAYINQSLTPGAGITPTKLKVVAFLNNRRVAYDDVTSITPNSWNTFKFTTPVEIIGNEDLTFGLHVVKHDPGEMPLYTDATTATDGKGNLFSEDNGVTWQKLSDFKLTHNWNITGNVRESQASEERANNVLGYEVFKNDVKINKGFIYPQQYIDSVSTNKAYYNVTAIYTNSGVSYKSATSYFDLTDISEARDAESLEIPTLVKDGFIIKMNADQAQINIFGLSGQHVYSGKVENNEFVDIHTLSTGVYILTSFDGKNYISKKFYKQ